LRLLCQVNRTHNESWGQDLGSLSESNLLSFFLSVESRD